MEPAASHVLSMQRRIAGTGGAGTVPDLALPSRIVQAAPRKRRETPMGVIGGGSGA